eukprot:g31024.t1
MSSLATLPEQEMPLSGAILPALKLLPPLVLTNAAATHATRSCASPNTTLPMPPKIHLRTTSLMQPPLMPLVLVLGPRDATGNPNL